MELSPQIIEGMAALIERYGITLVEVPDRLQEKLVGLLGAESRPEVEKILKPLRMGLLHNIRIRATHKISLKKLNETKELFKASNEFKPEEANQLTALWLKLLKVEVDAGPEEIAEVLPGAEEANLEFIQDVAPVVDNISMASNGDFETVVNQFDNARPVEEPQIEDYDGHFEDISFETVTDFTISDAENQLNKRLEDTSESINQILEKSPDYHQELFDGEGSEDKRKAVNKKNSTSSTKHPDRPDKKSYSASNSQPEPEKFSIDTALKALRSGNHSLASRIMMELARNGNTKAQYHLGEFYLNGTGIEKSREKALYWLRKAASRGSLPASDKLKQLENGENAVGCCSCLLMSFIAFIVINFLRSLF